MVAIINMNMPKNCAECELSEPWNVEPSGKAVYYCALIDEVDAYDDRRDDDCPLISV